jgi:hypothetical protein
LLSRTLITGLMLFVSCALPFFSSIMGFFGAWAPSTDSVWPTS